MTIVKARILGNIYPAALWTSENPVLLDREAGVEEDTGRMKYGDGVTAWNSLAYFDPSLPTPLDVPVGSAVSLTSATAANIGYIDLPDGRWLVQGNVYFIPAAGTTPSILRAWVSTVSATQPDIPNGGGFMALAITFPIANGQVFPTGAAIITAVGTTRVYLGTRCSFSGGTMTACGHMHAVRA